MHFPPWLMTRRLGFYAALHVGATRAMGLARGVARAAGEPARHVAEGYARTTVADDGGAPLRARTTPAGAYGPATSLVACGLPPGARRPTAVAARARSAPARRRRGSSCR